jgi:hypothetical protein
MYNFSWTKFPTCCNSLCVNLYSYLFLNDYKIILWSHYDVCNDISFCPCHLHSHLLNYIWSDLILVTFSYDILDIHVILSSIMDAIWMKTCNEKITSSFLLSFHCLLIKCPTNLYDYNFLHLGFEVISYYYS